MDEALADAAYEGLTVDLEFRRGRPSFGDLFSLVGSEHPDFAPTGRFGFGEHSDLGFQQVDDFFGIPSETDEGNDVLVWLYPVVDGEAVHHHPGPYSALRLDYSVLRNTQSVVELFLKTVERLAGALDVQIRYGTRNEVLDLPSALRVLRNDATQIIAHWKAQDVVPGSDDALLVEH